MGLTIGTLHVRRSIHIAASARTVWEQFSNEAAIVAWLDIGHRVHRFDPTVGGSADLSLEIDGTDRHFGGTVLVSEPEREVSLEIQWADPFAWQMPTFWTFLLQPLYQGTYVQFFHHGFERLGAAGPQQLADYEDGWDIRHLARLRDIVET